MVYPLLKLNQKTNKVYYNYNTILHGQRAHCMRISCIFLFILLIPHFSKAQATYPKSNRGKLFFYWGWNTDLFSKSDIKFKGDAYDFILKKVVASDRPTKFGLDAYFNPKYLSTPQYNFRLGYYLSDRYSLSVGMDHMKYVMKQNQIALINGSIHSGSAYDGEYRDQSISLQPNFLRFEHTNGLNYANIEIRRHSHAININHLDLNLVTGLSAGVLIPRTDAVLLNFPEYDEFHLAGYGLAALLGVNFTFFKSFFIQSEYKAGNINLPSIRTTSNRDDHASQQFWFGQLNLVFGGNVRIGK